MIFTVPNKNLVTAQKVSPGTFLDLKIWERQHIEHWVINNPEILGEELLILTAEFSGFEQSKDRLDVLALDRQGNVVVIELKRDGLAAYADLQALRYAAMVASLTIEKVIPYYIKFRKRVADEVLTEEQAKAEIQDFVISDTFEEFSTKARIILCSEDFSKEITSTVLWLRDFGVDLSCIKITPYAMEDKVVIVPRVLIPLEEAKQYLIGIQAKENPQQSKGTKRQRTVKILLENALVKAGDKVFLKNGLPSFLQFKKDNPIFSAEITGLKGQSDAIRWANDGQCYSLSNLAWSIFKEHHPEGKDPGGVNGAWHWVNEQGVSLWDLAEKHLASASTKA